MTAGACIACGGEMVFLSTERMRIGGSSGGWHLLFGEWADALEGVVDLDFSACRQCRRVEIKLPAGTQPEDSGLFAGERLEHESPLEADAQAWNPMLGPPPEGVR